MIDCCRECTKETGRSEYCHGSCERYLTARKKHIEEVREIAKKKRGDREHTDYIIKGKEQIANRVRSQHMQQRHYKHEV